MQVVVEDEAGNTSSTFSQPYTCDPITFSGELVLAGYGGVNGTRYLFSDNTYTGRTAITGAALELRDTGRLSATAGIDVNYGTFTINNGGLLDLSNRVIAVRPV